MADDRPKANWRQFPRRMRSISFQLTALISIAVLPVGVIAVWQSFTFAQEARESAETLLLGLTKESVALERRLIEAGLQIDPTLIASTLLVGNNQSQCRKALVELIVTYPILQSVAYVPLSGISVCSSNDETSDLRMDTTYLLFLEHPALTIARANGGAAPVLRILQPVREHGAVLGYLSLVLRTFVVPPAQNPSGIPNPSEVVLFNKEGTILGSTLNLQGVADRLPVDAEKRLLLKGPDGFVERTDSFGAMFGYVKVTLVADALFAIGIWPLDNPVSRTDRLWSRAIFYPLLMWLVGMGAALFAARRLVIRPVKMLCDKMRCFSLGQRNDAIALAPGAALEIQETVSTFNKLELIVAHNEAALALEAEGKLLMLREVHHRIKNNLQMISSIISIQRRKTEDPAVAKALGSLQDRVLGIAAVDQSLYANGDLADVRADVLIALIADRLVSVSLEPGHDVLIATRFDVVMLRADQIGPLSLLANEGVTNALKYVGKPLIGPPKIDISLTWHGDFIHFNVVNTTDAVLDHSERSLPSTHLGMDLIRAFCGQLAGECHSGLNNLDRKFYLSAEFRPNSLATTPTRLR